MLTSYNQLKEQAMRLDEASSNLELSEVNKYIALRQELMEIERQARKIEKTTHVVLLYTETAGTFAMYEYDYFMMNKDLIMNEIKEELDHDEIYSCHGSLREYRRFSHLARK